MASRNTDQHKDAGTNHSADANHGDIEQTERTTQGYFCSVFSVIHDALSISVRSQYATRLGASEGVNISIIVENHSDEFTWTLIVAPSCRRSANTCVL